MIFLILSPMKMLINYLKLFKRGLEKSNALNWTAIKILSKKIQKMKFLFCHSIILKMDLKAESKLKEYQTKEKL